MTRISLANLADLHILVKLFNKKYSFDYDIEYDQSLIEKFAEKSSITEEELRKHSLIEEKNKIEQCIYEPSQNLKIYSTILFTSWSIKGKKPIRFCPKCLDEDEIPYFRKRWRYIFFPFCPIHDCFLENS